MRATLCSALRGPVSCVIVVVIIAGMHGIAHAQSVDSLKALADRSPPDSSLVLLLNRIAQQLSPRDPDEALVYINDARALAEKLAWKQGKAEVLNTLGALHTNAGSFEQALTDFQQSRELYRTLRDETGISRALRNIGVVQRRIGNLQEAFDYTRRSLDAARSAGDSLAMAKALVNLGNIENQRKNNEKAIAYFNACNGIFRRAGDHFGESTVLNGMANAYVQLGRLTEALRLYRNSLEMNQRRGDMRAVAIIRTNIGEIHKKRKDWASAIRTYSQALETARDIGAMNLQRIASEHLAECLAATGNYRQAYQYQLQHNAIRDSLFNSEVLHQINSKTRAYEIREREQQIALLEATSKLQEERIARESLLRNFIILAVILLTVAAVWIFSIARKRKRRNAELRSTIAQLHRTQEQLIHAEKMATLGRLSTGIAHEILNPLNFINNFADLSSELLTENAVPGDTPLQLSREDLRSLQANLEKIAGYGRRAEGIVKSMVQHGEGSTEAPEPTDLNALLRRMLTIARGAQGPEPRDVPYILNLTLDGNIADLPLRPRELSRAILNLHQNALDALEEKAGEGNAFQPTISVSTRQEANSVVLRFQDNGSGITDSVLPRIFEPFFTTKSTGKNAGLGLSIAYDIIVEGHNGSIRAESTPGTGTEFIITLPRNSS
ncbi:tetratricopeptide repeat protein [bacterium]|nr:tetratricopeptide repeat protein [bacterium]